MSATDPRQRIILAVDRPDADSAAALVDAVGESVERVKQGEALAGSLSPCRALFAGSVLEMISVAEESGRPVLALHRDGGAGLDVAGERRAGVLAQRPGFGRRPGPGSPVVRGTG